MEFKQALRRRCSTRGFTSERVSDEDVKAIVERTPGENIATDIL